MYRVYAAVTKIGMIMHSGSDFAKGKKQKNRDAIEPRRRVYIGEVATPGLRTRAIYFAIRGTIRLAADCNSSQAIKNTASGSRQIGRIRKTGTALGGTNAALSTRTNRGESNPKRRRSLQGGLHSRAGQTRRLEQTLRRKKNKPRRNRRREKSLPERLIMAREPRRRREGLIATMSPRSQLAHAVMLPSRIFRSSRRTGFREGAAADEEGLNEPLPPRNCPNCCAAIYGEKRRSEKLRELPKQQAVQGIGRERIKPQPRGRVARRIDAHIPCPRDNKRALL